MTIHLIRSFLCHYVAFLNLYFVIELVQIDFVLDFIIRVRCLFRNFKFEKNKKWNRTPYIRLISRLTLFSFMCSIKLVYLSNNKETFSISVKETVKKISRL